MSEEIKVVEEMECPEGFTSFKVTTKDTDDTPVTATLSYNFGTTLAEAVELFGEDQVFSSAVANFKVKAQAVARRAIEAGQAPSDVLASWKPGDSLRITKPMDVKEAANAAIAKASAEELEEMLRKIQEAQAAR